MATNGQMQSKGPVSDCITTPSFGIPGRLHKQIKALFGSHKNKLYRSNPGLDLSKGLLPYGQIADDEQPDKTSLLHTSNYSEDQSFPTRAHVPI